MRKIRSAFRLALTAFLTVGHFAFFQFGRLFVGSSHARQLRWRNRCVRAWARSLGATAGMKITVDGKPPEAPFFLVANHLSYIDIIALSIVMDCVFIAKSEIEGWPGVGFMAKHIGTIFIERSNFQDLPRVISLIERALDEGKGIILFAEGTSGKGDKVLPFSSALLEPAARLGQPVSHASITYRTPPNELPAEEAVCWWGDMTMFPHLVATLESARVRCRDQIWERTNLRQRPQDAFSTSVAGGLRKLCTGGRSCRRILFEQITRISATQSGRAGRLASPARGRSAHRRALESRLPQT